MKKPGLHWYVYDFAVKYASIDIDDLLDFHKYLMKKHYKNFFGMLITNTQHEYLATHQPLTPM